MIPLTFTEQEFNILMEALGQIPLKAGIGVYQSIQKQLVELQSKSSADN